MLYQPVIPKNVAKNVASQTYGKEILRWFEVVKEFEIDSLLGMSSLIKMYWADLRPVKCFFENEPLSSIKANLQRSLLSINFLGRQSLMINKVSCKAIPPEHLVQYLLFARQPPVSYRKP